MVNPRKKEREREPVNPLERRRKADEREYRGVVIPTLIGLMVVKMMLYQSYSSTDLEVHRNWKAITHNLPLSEWYEEKTSEWTLDYPPFFAYFEWFLSRIASLLGMEDILTIQKEALMNTKVLYFMRTSVLLSDAIYLAVVYYVCSKIQRVRARICTFLLLSTHTALVILDNVHFQYNAMLTAMVIGSIVLMQNNQYLWAALVYAVLLNFKHIYLYYAPGFVVCYLIHWFDIRSLFKNPILSTLKKASLLLLTLLLPFLLSLSPLLLSSSSPLSSLSSILSRLFPVQRGLTHSYWAPNAYAIYNTLDLILNKVLTRAGWTLPQPMYTSGLVQEYSHTVLPTIGVGSSLLLLLFSLLPLFSLIRIDRLSSSPLSSPSFHLLLSSLSFFFFGYHVHEKALLLPLIPMIFLVSKYAAFSSLFLDFTLVCSSSLGPLLFTTEELPLRMGFLWFQFVIAVFFVHKMHQQPIARLLTAGRSTVLVALSMLDVVNCYMQKLLFPSSPFMSLLLLSLLNSLLLLSIFIRVASMAFPYPWREWVKWRCRRKERRFLASSISTQIHSIEGVRWVGALDIEVTARDPSLAVVAFVLFDMQEGTKVSSEVDVVVYNQEYIPHFLALSEVDHYERIVREWKRKNPEMRCDVIVCDGNGRFHPRGFGLACHVAAATGIPTIGLAKNLDWGVLEGDVNGRKVYGERMKKLIWGIPHKLGWAPCHFFRPPVLNLIAYPQSTRIGYLSAGLGISLEHSTQIILKLMAKGIAATHEADNLARRVASDLAWC